MFDDAEKFRYYRILIYVLAFIILFEVGMLAWAIPEKSTFIIITLSALGFLCLYLIILCLRLVKELQENSKKK